MRIHHKIIALLLWPLSVAATRVLLDLLNLLPAQFEHGLSLNTRGLLIGGGLWLFTYIAMPRPIRTYVLGHELTHAIWGWAMGAEVKGIKVTSRGGHVWLTKSNFLITLAPYFFPFYTVLVCLLYVCLSFFWDLRVYDPFWMGCVGFTWAFHLTFTYSFLRMNQPDVQEYGRLFSYTIIYLFNILGLSIGLRAMLHTDWTAWSLALWDQSLLAYRTIGHALRFAFEHLHNHLQGTDK